MRDATKKKLGNLRDPELLAKDVYEYWVHSLKSDGFQDDIDEWDDLDHEIKLHFIEAVEANATRPFERVLGDMEVEISILEASQAIDKLEEKKPAPRQMVVGGAGGGGGKVILLKEPCYYCGRAEAVRDSACAKCLELARS